MTLIAILLKSHNAALNNLYVYFDAKIKWKCYSVNGSLCRCKWWSVVLQNVVSLLATEGFSWFQLPQMSVVIFMSRIKLATRRTIKSWKIFCAAKLNEANRMVCCNSFEKWLVLFLAKSGLNELLGGCCCEDFWSANDLDSISKFIPPNKSADFNWAAFSTDKIGCDMYKWDWWNW